jgi:FtsZ-binding cell division protein ZapB
LTVLVLAALGWAAQPVSPGDVEDIRATMTEWVETKRLISKEKQDWAYGRQMLEERVKLVEREIESLREKTDEAQKSIGEADVKRAELVAENDKLKSAGAKLAEIITTLEGQTVALDKRLPDPVRQRVRLVAQQIPEDPNQTSLSLSQRFINVIGVLNEVDKFNQTIEASSEMRKLADGSEAEVTAVYVGLGQAYYSGANGTIGGVGRPGRDGWHWEAANDAAGKVADVIAMLKNEKVAGFVPLPVVIEQGTANGQQ